MIAFAWSANGNEFNRYPTSSINLLQMNTIKIEMELPSNFIYKD